MKIEKKLFVAIMLVVMTFSVSAQVFLSGNVGYNYKNFSRSLGFDVSQPSGFRTEATLQLGYAFSEAVRAGICFGVGYDNYHYYNGFYNPSIFRQDTIAIINEDNLTFSGSAFLRTRIANVGNLSFHLEFSLGFASGRGLKERVERTADAFYEDVTINYPTNTRTFAAQMVPVLNYAFTPHWSMDIYVDILTLSYRRVTTIVGKGQEKGYSNGIVEDYRTTEKSFDLEYKHLKGSLVSVGLCYTF